MPPPQVVLATASYDRTIRFWDAATGMCTRTLNFQDSQINCMCTSPDRTVLTAAGYKHIRMYDLAATGQAPLSTVEAHSGNVTALVYTRDAKHLISAGEDGFIKIWDKRTVSCKKKFEVKAPVNTIALHADQCTIVSGDHTGRLCVWDTKADDCVQELVPGGDVGIRSLGIASRPCTDAPGGLLCAANNTGEVFVLWLISAAAFPSGSSGDRPRGFRLRPACSFKAHNKYILKCLLSPDSSLLATCSADYTVALWHTALTRTEGAKPWTCYKSLQGHHRWVWDCSFSHDGKYLVTASSDNTAKLWEVEKGTEVVNYNGHHKPVTCVVVDDQKLDRPEEGQRPQGAPAVQGP
eukprot:TRINITY_DN60321_c0_g1_i1.p1 TRINITY_DN60321_c0_g1~~TRINITY_DN60321_c0_g1_i1.p1  ORF type:complete len:374 (+),score=90.73 TRINITY_DN60321_c0_g1_i1:72-1124(+)